MTLPRSLLLRWHSRTVIHVLDPTFFFTFHLCGRGSGCVFELHSSAYESCMTRSTVDSSELWYSTVCLCPRTQAFRRCGGYTNALYVTSRVASRWVIWHVCAGLELSSLSWVEGPGLFDIVSLICVVANLLCVVSLLSPWVRMASTRCLCVRLVTTLSN